MGPTPHSKAIGSRRRKNSRPKEAIADMMKAPNTTRGAIVTNPPPYAKH